MSIEIERKFLVQSDEWRAQTTGQVRICQGYLGTDGGFSTRVRIVDGHRATLADVAVLGARVFSRPSPGGRRAGETEQPKTKEGERDGVIDRLCPSCQVGRAEQKQECERGNLDRPHRL